MVCTGNGKLCLLGFARGGVSEYIAGTGRKIESVRKEKKGGEGDWNVMMVMMTRFHSALYCTSRDFVE